MYEVYGYDWDCVEFYYKFKSWRKAVQCFKELEHCTIFTKNIPEKVKCVLNIWS